MKDDYSVKKCINDEPSNLLKELHKDKKFKKFYDTFLAKEAEEIKINIIANNFSPQASIKLYLTAIISMVNGIKKTMENIIGAPDIADSDMQISVLTEIMAMDEILEILKPLESAKYYNKVTTCYINGDIIKSYNKGKC